MYTSNDKLWADILEAADAARVPRNTYSQWLHRGYVPPSRHYELVEAAQRTGVTGLTHKKLHAMWKRRG